MRHLGFESCGSFDRKFEETSENLWKFEGTSENLWKFEETSENLWKFEESQEFRHLNLKTTRLSMSSFSSFFFIF
jgi:hypothetical protein